MTVTEDSVETETVATPINVLIPSEAPGPMRRLLDIGSAVIDRYGGTGTALSVVEIEAERSLSEAALIVRRRRQLLSRIMQLQDEPRFEAEVTTAHSAAGGIRNGVLEAGAQLLLLPWQQRVASGRHATLKDLVADPPCDLAAVRGGSEGAVGRVLLAVRGGPHAQLALKVAEAVAERHNALLTVLHIDVSRWTGERRDAEERFFKDVRERSTYPYTRLERVSSDSVEEVLLASAAQHDVVVLGAVARDLQSPHLFGRIPERVAQRLGSTVIVVKTREPVTARTFGLPARTLENVESTDISELVDRWFAENTFHSHEFRAIRDLIDLKERQGTTISLVLPTLNEEKTVGKILTTIKKQLVERYPLVDELLVVDSDSTDRTVEIATSLDVPVFKHPEILPQYGSHRGKGEALWKSLYVTRGDIVAWVDADITGFHPKFVYGLVGPLLTQSKLGFVKGFYRRPINLDGQVATTGGGRVTELTARPLINLFYPALSGLVQPLAGEMAGRRELLEATPFFTGYGVEIGLLVDILDRFGLRSIAQTDLEERVHRNQSLLALTQMAFAIVQVVVKRLGQGRRLAIGEELSTSMKLIHYSPSELFLEIREIQEGERPPIESLPEYRARRDSWGGMSMAAATSAPTGQSEQEKEHE